MQQGRITSLAPQPLALSIALALAPALAAHAQDTQSTPHTDSTTLELNTLLIESVAPEPAAESSVSTLTREQIDNTLSTDLEQLLRYEPGVNVTT